VIGAGLSALTIDRGAYERIVSAAIACFPEECCGVLVGTARAGAAHVKHAIRARNVAPRRLRGRSFEVDPAVLFTVQRALRDRRGKRPREVVLGYFHSHPLGIARPSRADLAGAHEPGLITLIAVPSRPRTAVAMRAWLRLGNGDARRFRPVRLRIAQ
jgi:proteasome lid subunit RPN8/RPN11